MNFGDAIQAGFANYANFLGRASRSEYWYWFLFVIIGLIITAIIGRVIGVRLIYWLFELAVILPGIAVSVRRLHDLDRSGWWLLLDLIPLIGALVLLVWFCGKGTDGPNRFGPDPRAGAAHTTPLSAA